LTPREREVALLVERNFSNEEIALELGIELGTVKVHVHKILKKGGLSPRLRRPSKVVRVWHKGLTPRERKVAWLLGRNLSNDEIARQLGIKLSTVKTHVHNIVIKLDAVSGARRRRWSKDAATAAGRKRISEAQQRRWQRWRAARSEETEGCG
jgi:DNA-binding NarL/FixJ family response regulator